MTDASTGATTQSKMSGEPWYPDLERKNKNDTEAESTQANQDFACNLGKALSNPGFKRQWKR